LSNLLLDTSVLIDHLREYKPATDFLETVFNRGVLVTISAVTEMELYTGKSMENPAIEAAVLKFLVVLLYHQRNRANTLTFGVWSGSFAKLNPVLIAGTRYLSLYPISWRWSNTRVSPPASPAAARQRLRGSNASPFH